MTYNGVIVGCASSTADDLDTAAPRRAGEPPAPQLTHYSFACAVMARAIHRKHQHEDSHH